MPEPPYFNQRLIRWIGWLLWGLSLLWIALGLSIAYGGFLLNPGSLLLYLAGFYSLSTKTSSSATSIPATRWAYVAAGAALVVALTHYAADPKWYGLWYGGAASLLALAFVRWPSTSRAGAGSADRY